MESEQLQRAIEAILFAAGERIDIGRLAAALETDASDVEKAADELADKYAFEAGKTPTSVCWTSTRERR